MDINEILNYCNQKLAVEETFPFNPDILVLKVGGKMFLLMSLDQSPLSINLKADPEWSQELRAQYPQITPGYHMNKTHWNTVQIEGLKPELIKKMIDESYDLVFRSLTKKIKEEIDTDRIV